jgi:hypothetical protein
VIVEEEFEWNGLQPNQSPASLLVKPGTWGVTRRTELGRVDASGYSLWSHDLKMSETLIIGAGPAMEDGD